MKRLWVLMMVALLVLSLTGCGASTVTENDLKGKVFRGEQPLTAADGSLADDGYAADSANGKLDPTKIYYQYFAVHTMTFKNDGTVEFESKGEGRLLHNETGNYAPDTVDGTASYSDYDYCTVEYQDGKPYLCLPGLDNKFLIVLDSKGKPEKINLLGDVVLVLVAG